MNIEIAIEMMLKMVRRRLRSRFRNIRGRYFITHHRSVVTKTIARCRVIPLVYDPTGGRSGNLNTKPTAGRLQATMATIPQSYRRIVKKPDQRRNELLDCAQELFLARGYDNTTINDVIARAGVSKGALYHYFTSKEAMLEALAERFAARSIEALGDIFEDRSPDALSRLNAFLA